MRFLLVFVIVIGCVPPERAVRIVNENGSALWQRIPSPPNRPGEECWALLAANGQATRGVICAPPPQ